MTAHIDDLNLIQRLLARQRQAWQEFVLRYQGSVCGQIARVARQYNYQIDQADIDDICAEIFAGLIANDLASLRQFQGLSTIATWLSVITRRTCLRMLAKKRLDRATGTLHDGSDRFAEMTAITEDKLGELVRAETAEHVNETLNMLNQRDREILHLFYREEQGYREISQRMGISINSVGPKLQRAQQRLRKLLRYT